MAKKMSVAEILAAARAEKNKGAAAPPAAQEAPAADAAAPETGPVAAAAPESAPPPTAAPKAAGAKVAPGGKGMSMAEILAAARAKKSDVPAAAPKPAAVKPAPKPAAEKPAPKPAAAKPAAAKETAAPAVAKDTASILAAARKGAKPGPMTKAEAAAKAGPAAPAGKKKIEVPPMPAKPDYARPQPAAAAAEDADGATRRTFLAATMGALFGSSLAVGFTSLTVTHLMWLLGFARFMFPNILIEPPTRFKVGFPDQLAPGQVETKFIPQFGVWVVKYEFDGQPMIFAIKSVCTHLGCTPNWLEAEQKFKCPCHGSGFYKDGVNFEGPAPRPLERYSISLADDGQLLVDKSRTFQYELGQWKDTASYVPV